MTEINQDVSLDWVVENLGGSFIDDQPDCLEHVEEHQVSIRFEGKGRKQSYGALAVAVEVSVPGGTPQAATLPLPPMTFLDVVEGWLIITLPDGSTVRRWWEEDADMDPDWIVAEASRGPFINGPCTVVAIDTTNGWQSKPFHLAAGLHLPFSSGDLLYFAGSCKKTVCRREDGTFYIILRPKEEL